jgi:hypothetical protein
MHAEMKLAMGALYQGCRSNIYFLVSKQPCFLCETWFQNLNSLIDPHAVFFIPEGPKTICEAWKHSGLKKVDDAVVSENWEQFDKISEGVTYIQKSDTVISVASKQTTPVSINAEDMVEIEPLKRCTRENGNPLQGSCAEE